jgi:phosphoglycolate phosphatase
MSATILLFDLDGTLVDSVPDLTGALNRVLVEHGYEPLTAAEVAPMVGDGVPALIERGFAARGASSAEAADALPRYIAIYEAHATELTRPYPGVPETLAELRRSGYRTAVCTNKLQRASLTVLAGLGLAPLFDAVAGGDRYPVKKPYKGHLLGLIAELGGVPERAVMIGDSENDAAAAHAAGVPLVIMRYGYSRRDPATLGAAVVLDTFAELPAALERLGLDP